jgi:transcriptional regulator with XRE-family HTH domain
MSESEYALTPQLFEQHLQAFGARLRAIRRARDLTQDQVAERAGSKREYVSDIERGKINITLGTVFRLARALNTDAAAFFDDRDNTNLGSIPPYRSPDSTD